MMINMLNRLFVPLALFPFLMGCLYYFCGFFSLENFILYETATITSLVLLYFIAVLVWEKRFKYKIIEDVMFVCEQQPALLKKDFHNLCVCSIFLNESSLQSNPWEILFCANGKSYYASFNKKYITILDEKRFQYLTASLIHKNWNTIVYLFFIWIFCLGVCHVFPISLNGAGLLFGMSCALFFSYISRSTLSMIKSNQFIVPTGICKLLRNDATKKSLICILNTACSSTCTSEYLKKVKDGSNIEYEKIECKGVSYIMEKVN